HRAAPPRPDRSRTPTASVPPGGTEPPPAPVPAGPRTRARVPHPPSAAVTPADRDAVPCRPALCPPVPGPPRPPAPPPPPLPARTPAPPAGTTWWSAPLPAVGTPQPWPPSGHGRPGWPSSDR